MKQFQTLKMPLLWCMICMLLSLPLEKNGLAFAISEPVILKNFEQAASSITLEFAKKPIRVKVLTFDKVPKYLNLNKHTHESKYKINKYRVIVPTTKEPANEYSVVIEIDKHFVEIIRQPKTWLFHKFGFKREGGYSILGRKSISVQNAVTTSKLQPLSFYGVPQKQESVSIKKSSNRRDFDLAKNILKALWQKPIQQGPTNKAYSDFLKKSLEIKLQDVNSGNFSVMCQGFRDLFLHATSAYPQLKARGIEAYNYHPPFKDLIPFGHSTAEVWLPSQKKWVLFDPWNGISLSYKGKLLSANEIKSTLKKDIKVVPLLDEISRFTTDSNGKKQKITIKPANLDLFAFTKTNTNSLPPYIDYFNHIKIRTFHTKALK